MHTEDKSRDGLDERIWIVRLRQKRHPGPNYLMLPRFFLENMRRDEHRRDFAE
jgi:hypothetical protein